MISKRLMNIPKNIVSKSRVFYDITLDVTVVIGQNGNNAFHVAQIDNFRKVEG